VVFSYRPKDSSVTSVKVQRALLEGGIIPAGNDIAATPGGGTVSHIAPGGRTFSRADPIFRAVFRFAPGSEVFPAPPPGSEQCPAPPSGAEECPAPQRISSDRLRFSAAFLHVKTSGPTNYHAPKEMAIHGTGSLGDGRVPRRMRYAPFVKRIAQSRQ
jgi:hypothetical protein